MIAHFLSILRGSRAPALVLEDVQYVDVYLRTIRRGNIWIDRGRIVYVGEQLPKTLEGTERVTSDALVVPGYIEPHVHPFQLYHPESFAHFAATTGTTTLIADNFHLFTNLSNESSFRILDQLKKGPFTWKWWMRMDAQTQMLNERLFTYERLLPWLRREDVIVGGELTGWPQALKGEETLRSFLQASVEAGHYVEGHLPGASDQTLAQMKWLGVTGDHEAMTLEDVEARLRHGYHVTLRHSSIRPDLLPMIKEMKKEKWEIGARLMMTTDGSPPLFYQEGVMDTCIRQVGQTLEDWHTAYQMATITPAETYRIDREVGAIATGRVAHLNFLNSLDDPTPRSVLASGTWIKKDGKVLPIKEQVAWEEELTRPPLYLLDDDLEPVSSTTRLVLMNDVLMKMEERTEEKSEHYLVVIGRAGNWRIRTRIHGFPEQMEALVSSFSLTGDTIFIYRSKRAAQRAFERLEQRGGGIVLADDENVQAEIPLPIGGFSSHLSFPQLMEKEKLLKQKLAAYGEVKGDIIFTLLFLQSTHLPFVRITERGIIDILKNKCILPAEQRSM